MIIPVSTPGLDSVEAEQRLQQYGLNRLEVEEKEPFWREFLEELREPLILLLAFTGVLYLLLGEVGDGVLIFLVILALNTIEVVNEQRAGSAIAALKQLAQPTALVMRDGQPHEIAVEQVAPGDVILLQAGRRVPADGRLLESYGLAADESLLTGEAAPVDKDAAQPDEAGAPLAERANRVYAGTLISRGRGRALVTETGMATQLGQIARLARRVKEPRTPLQQAMTEVSRSLLWLALVFSILIPLLGVWIARQPVETMLMTGLSLAFAAIPEEMPIIITLALALSASRLSKQKAIVKRLKAVEALGAVTVIAADKTGTLTENRLQVSEIYPPANRQRILLAGILCSDALANNALAEGLGSDPLESAMLQASRREGLDAQPLVQAQRRATEFPFDNLRKRMSVVYAAQEAGEAYHAWVKGAPESILPAAAQGWSEEGVRRLEEPGRQAALAQAEAMAQRGLRVVAFAEKRLAERPESAQQAESDLIFLGLAGLLDPPREEVGPALQQMQRAGIRSILITGDHPLTARAVAERVGLPGRERLVSGAELDRMSQEELRQAVQQTSIFARTTPQHKLQIVQALAAQGERVAVTGDGVNDAAALAAADIGLAMGASGSDVAREAADIVLADDRYTTIVHAVGEGRAMFHTLQKTVQYYLACKAALIAINLLAVLLRLPPPFAPIQIILMELFMDLAAAAAFVAEPPAEDLMERPPRDPRQPFLDRPMISGILRAAAGLFAAVSVVYLVNWYSASGQAAAQTAAFSAWMLGHVGLAFSLRAGRGGLRPGRFFTNRLMLGWAGAALAFVLLATLATPLHPFLKTSGLDAPQWVLILAALAAALTIFTPRGSGRDAKRPHERVQN